MRYLRILRIYYSKERTLRNTAILRTTVQVAAGNGYGESSRIRLACLATQVFIALGKIGYRYFKRITDDSSPLESRTRIDFPEA